MRWKLSFIVLVLAVVVSACAAVPSQPVTVVETRVVEVVATATPEPVRENFIFVRPQEIVSLDPAIATESQSGIMIRNVYSRLVDLSYDGSELNADLAEGWEVSDDGLVYTFHLRDGVTFQDGTPLTAGDVVYSFDRMLSIGEGNASSFLEWMDVGSVEALDDSTVQFTLNAPFEAFLFILGKPLAPSILSQAWVEANATEDDPWATGFVASNMMGTGPYSFVEWVPNEFARMERYDDYYGGVAAIPSVVSMLGQDDTTTRLALEKGEVDAAQRLPDDMFRVMGSNPAVTVYQKPTTSSAFWVFNTNIEPYNDERVREAFALAVDYDGLMDGLVKDSGSRMNSPVYESMPFHHADLPLIERDVEKAKELLADAGYPDGLDIDLVYVDFGLLKQVSVVLQANLLEAGIRANLVEMPFNPFLEGVGEGTIGFYSWVSEPAYPLPMAVLARFTAEQIGQGLGANIAEYNDPEYDALIEQIRATEDEEELQALYQQAQEMVMDAMPWLLLYQENQYQAARADVKGFDFGAYNYLDLRDVTIEN
ncbi:MAG: ABC transporter substrate-binding protein [Chloroflexi bacterium]|nr:ABC transporter substrate-binding protein [Chloroflexota bacterium]